MKPLAWTILLAFTFTLAAAQLNQQTMEKNGWEFLAWGISLGTAQTELQSRQIPCKQVLQADSSGYGLQFIFQEMLTTLHFGKADALHAVDQSRFFSILEKAQAKAFYQETLARCRSAFGDPKSIKEDPAAQETIVEWLTEVESIVLRFDYEDKIIDEFGMDSYQVELKFRRE